MKSKLSGQITLETAIVLPIVMLIVATFISISLYVHDVITVKSYAYSLAVEYRECNLDEFTKNVCGKIARTPLFVMDIKAECTRENDTYKVAIYPRSKDQTGWLKAFFTGRDSITVEVEKKINTEIMYALRAVTDKLE